MLFVWQFGWGICGLAILDGLYFVVCGGFVWCACFCLVICALYVVFACCVCGCVYVDCVCELVLFDCVGSWLVGVLAVV